MTDKTVEQLAAYYAAREDTLRSLSATREQQRTGSEMKIGNEGDDYVVEQLRIAAKAMVSALAGRDADEVPELQTAAVKLMAYWYDQRGLMSIGCVIDPVPLSVRDVIDRHRLVEPWNEQPDRHWESTSND